MRRSLAYVALGLALVLGGSRINFSLSSVSAATMLSQLPNTLPGLSRDEGTFLITDADDGSRALYFVAQNARHSILQSDLQFEQQLNPLWPTRAVTRDEIMAIPEGAPVGRARFGLVTVAADETETADAPTDSAQDGDPSFAAPQIGELFTYVLKPGDNLTRVATQYGTTVQAILAVNHVANPNRVFAGQPLVIPASTPVVETPAPPQPVADEPQPVADDPQPIELAEDQPADVAPTTYTVKPGDSALKIARKYGVEVDALLAANGVVNRNRVYAGQVLTIPQY